jgi:hypothetical protein
MRNFLFLFAFAFIALSANAQDYALFWKYKDYGGVTFSIPAPAIDLASLFADEREERQLIRKVNKVRVMVFEGESPVTAKDLRKFDRRAKRRHLEELITVREGKNNVRIMIKDRRKAIRKVVVLVQSPEEFVLVSLKGRFKWKDINKLMDKYGKEINKKENKPVMPLKIPVIRA